MYRLSNYLVRQEFYDSSENLRKIILFSTRSSTIKIVDKNTYLKMKEGDFHFLDDETFKKLKKNYFIVKNNTDELQTILDENKKFIESNKELYLTIQPTAFCPFGCHYCGQLHSPQQMTREIQTKILQRVEKIITLKEYTSLRICWFGSEPLSGLNIIRDLSPELQRIAKEQGITYSAKIVTNGWRLTLPIAYDLVDTHKVDHIEITLDGTAEFHNARRHTKSGQETFDTIYNNIKNICNEFTIHTKIRIRCNVDERNKEGISPLIRKLAKDNLQDKLYLYFAQIHSWGNDADKLAADKKKFSEWEIEWLLEMESCGFKVNYLQSRKKQVCMALNPLSELIDPFGGIYGCTEVSLVPTYVQSDGLNSHELGSVKNSPNEKLKVSEFTNFYERQEINKFSCSKCEIFPICGGACPKEWKEGRIPCPSIKFNTPERLMLSVVKSLKKEEYNKTLKMMNESI